jgi:hypothetical protein
VLTQPGVADQGLNKRVMLWGQDAVAPVVSVWHDSRTAPLLYPLGTFDVSQTVRTMMHSLVACIPCRSNVAASRQVPPGGTCG